MDRNVFRGDEAALRAWFGLPPEGAVVDMGGPVHGVSRAGLRRHAPRAVAGRGERFC